jgi:hypothetical protein
MSICLKIDRYQQLVSGGNGVSVTRRTHYNHETPEEHVGSYEFVRKEKKRTVYSETYRIYKTRCFEVRFITASMPRKNSP